MLAKCPKCNGILDLPPGFAGRGVRCPLCLEDFQVEKKTVVFSSPECQSCGERTSDGKENPEKCGICGGPLNPEDRGRCSGFCSECPEDCRSLGRCPFLRQNIRSLITPAGPICSFLFLLLVSIGSLGVLAGGRALLFLILGLGMTK